MLENQKENTQLNIRRKEMLNRKVIRKLWLDHPLSTLSDSWVSYYLVHCILPFLLLGRLFNSQYMYFKMFSLSGSLASFFFFFFFSLSIHYNSIYLRARLWNVLSHSHSVVVPGVLTVLSYVTAKRIPYNFRKSTVLNLWL